MTKDTDTYDDMDCDGGADTDIDTDMRELIEFLGATAAYVQQVGTALPADPEADARVEAMLRKHYASRGEGELL